MEPIRTTLNCATHGIPAPPGSRILRLLVLAELLVEEPRPPRSQAPSPAAWRPPASLIRQAGRASSKPPNASGR